MHPDGYMDLDLDGHRLTVGIKFYSNNIPYFVHCENVQRTDVDNFWNTKSEKKLTHEEYEKIKRNNGTLRLCFEIPTLIEVESIYEKLREHRRDTGPGLSL